MMKMITRLSLVPGMLMLLAGCASSPSQTASEPVMEPLAAERMAVALEDAQPATRASAQPPAPPAELPALLLQRETAAPERRFDVRADDVEIRQFLRDLSDVSGSNILWDNEVNGRVSLNLRQVRVVDVMLALQDSLGVSFEEAQYGYRVLGNQLRTEMFRVNYLDVVREGNSSTGISSGQIGGQQSSQINTTNQTNFWGNLQSTLQLMMAEGNGRQLIVNPQSGLIVVRALPTELRTIRQFLYQAELALQQQVIIEARILEVRLSSNFESGIDWRILGSDIVNVAGGSTSVGGNIGVSGNAVSSPSDEGLGGVFNLALNIGNFNSVIRALRSQGEVEVLSSPRISTLNNQKAVIKVGGEEQFVTVSSVTSANDDGTSSSAPTFTLEPFFSGIALDVTPQITDNDQIILHVQPSVVQVNTATRSFTIQGESYNLPVASSSIRQTDSVIRAQNGQLVVIGGLMQNASSRAQSGVPNRGDGFFGWLFGQRRSSDERTELVILLRPVIVGQDTYDADLDATIDRLRR